MGATAEPRHGNGHAGYSDEYFREIGEWRDHARVMLQPVAAPSVLGLFGFAIATFMVTANLVGWFGTAKSPALIFPLATASGGIAQGAAALWAYRARDTLATAVHGIWASFWLGYGVLQLLIATKVLPAPPPHGPVPELGYWFFALSAVTLAAMLAAIAESLSVTSVLLLLGCGSAFLGIFWTVGGTTWQDIAGYVTMGSAVAAFYTATAMMLASTWGRTVLPLGKFSRDANVPGGRPIYPIQFASGEPGVRQGQ
jgi:succinate-acetate transporter protein